VGKKNGSVDQAYNTCDPEEYREKLLFIINKEIADKDSHNPDDGSQHSPLGTGALPVREQSIIEDKRGRNEKENDQFLFGFPESLDNSKKRKKVQRRV